MLNKLTASKIKAAGSGKYGDGGGLWLHKRTKEAGKWVMIFTFNGKRHEKGLGGYPSVGLKEAREVAQKCRALIQLGQNPLTETTAEKTLSLAEVCEDCFEARKSGLKGEGKAGRWYSPLALHILPKLGTSNIAEISPRDIRDCLKPIWNQKPETARKAINRLGIVFRHASALGLVSSENRHTVEDARVALGPQKSQTKNIPAMDWRNVPAFYSTLDRTTTVGRALSLLILTSVRSNPLRNAQTTQISGDVWTIPGKLMKGRVDETKDFRVPLSSVALDVISKCSPNHQGSLFPGARGQTVISDMAMSQAMRRAGLNERPHGFRSSFRSWAADNHSNRFSWEAVETALSHKVGNRIERSYQRSDLLDQRRDIMEAWAQFVTGKLG